MIYSPAKAQWGGGHLYIDTLCNYLNRNGLNSAIFTSTPNLFKSNTIKLKHGISYKGRLIEAIKVAKEYKKEYSDIILNDISSLWLAPIFRLFGYRVYALLHNYLKEGNTKGLGHKRYQIEIIKFASKFCHHIFSVNRENIDIFGSNRVTFVGNFISDWFFSQTNIDNKTYDFLIVARLAKQKNIPLFLEILHKLNRFNKFNLLIVGEGEEENVIKDTISKYHLEDCVELRGWIDREELPSIYDSAKCFVISSHHEGFATTLLEAHARGVPAIVTKSSGFCVEFIDNYGEKSGIVFDIDDIEKEDFYKEVIKLIKEYHKYKHICISKAKEFSEDRVLGKIVGYINETES